MLRPCFVSTAAGANRFISGIIPQPHETVRSLSALSSLPTLLTSVKVFDGSEITDAIVVSNTFWSTLSSKLPYLLLAQLLASITFVIIAYLVTAQGKFLIDQVAPNGNDETRAKGKNTQFRRADEPPPPPLDFTKLFLCICIDIVGTANELIPFVGELVDIVYAPIAALLLRQLFSGSNVVFILEFAEEILPFTDVLPLATICWVVESFFGDGRLAQALRIGEFAGRADSGDYTDVERKGKEKIVDADIDRNKMPSQSEEKGRDDIKR